MNWFAEKKLFSTRCKTCISLHLFSSGQQPKHSPTVKRAPSHNSIQRPVLNHHRPFLLPSFKGSQEDNTCSGHLPQTMQVPTQGPSPRMTTTTEFTRIWTASHVRPKVQLRPTLLGVQARARKNDLKPSCKGLNNCWPKGRPKGPRALVECLK